MRIINLFSKSVLSSSLLMISAVSFAHNGDDHGAKATTTAMPMDHSQMNHQQMNHAEMNHADMKHGEMDHSQHIAPAVQSVPEAQPVQDHTTHSAPASASVETAHQGHNHRKEHGAQIYAVTTVDNKWLVNEDGAGALKSEFETRIGTDENKVFIKVHAEKQESHDTHYDAKILYSRMISDFWDAQIGARYRSEKVELDHHRKDTEENVDAVIGLHGMAPYFFETDAYLYAGEDSYAGFSLETERDLLITQKLIVQPYLDLKVIFSDDSKYAKKAGLSNVTAGLETRYEISKKVMPYLDIAYEYSKGNDETLWQVQSDSEKGWLYGAGVRFKF
ncbi:MULTISPECIES: copper resistance protein B [Acinetobacter]|uniref:Copper resistance protein B n=2 Tax=Acinetobacter TaxID=469 RepID=A0A4Q7ATR1_9GAMM|nr:MULTISPECIES: copper resistance protein B [Acinetobacter]MCW8039949.1 copper resistance protein B [Acinetobacter entericus]RZG65048.1 copper resistance protein B [Acinetobacter bouvetii]TCB71171.1 copper resistance protein B [Acinetobacter sp. ANC 4177]